MYLSSKIDIILLKGVNMKEIIITKADHGHKVEKFVRKFLSDAPLSFIYKLFRVKDVKVNGKRISKDYILSEMIYYKYMLRINN